MAESRSNSLKTIVEEKSGPTLVIEGITFQLHVASFENDKKHILYSSVTPDRKRSLYATYKSSSEGFWRLAILFGMRYEKGKDYLTTTFLHMELQNFFEKNYERLPQKPFLSLYSYLSYPILDEIQNLNDQNQPSEDRFVYDPFFSLLNYYCPHPSGRGEGCLSNPQAMVEKAGSKWKYKKRTHIHNTNNKEGQIMNILHMDPTIEDEMKNIIQIYQKAIQTCGKTMDERDAIQIMSIFLEKYFHVKTGIQKYLFDVELSFTTPANSYSGLKADTVTFPLHIFMTLIRNEKTGNEYFLYYCLYEYRGKYYKGIVNLVPLEAKILPNGLYSKYVSAGYLIFKPFDYTIQCSGMAAAQTCRTQYLFLGEALTQLWPLPLLNRGRIPTGAAAISGTAGGRRKATRRKHRGKKRTLRRQRCVRR